jgi:DNA-binding transcriptional ArsR family regulator
MRRDVFQAIADPTRREIIALIANKKMNLNAVAENFMISRPAISKHMKILVECGLVNIRQEGRERFCSARLKDLHEISEWLEPYRQFWESKIDNLEKYLDQLQKEPVKNKYGKRKK